MTRCPLSSPPASCRPPTLPPRCSPRSSATGNRPALPRPPPPQTSPPAPPPPLFFHPQTERCPFSRGRRPGGVVVPRSCPPNFPPVFPPLVPVLCLTIRHPRKSPLLPRPPRLAPRLRRDRWRHRCGII